MEYPQSVETRKLGMRRTQIGATHHSTAFAYFCHRDCVSLVGFGQIGSQRNAWPDHCRRERLVKLVPPTGAASRFDTNDCAKLCPKRGLILSGNSARARSIRLENEYCYIAHEHD